MMRISHGPLLIVSAIGACAAIGVGCSEDRGPPFQQSASGLVSIEAEHYSASRENAGTEWQQVSIEGNSGGAAMQVLPNGIGHRDTAFVDVTPRLELSVRFVKTGTHYLWVRGLGPDADSVSVHGGIDNAETPTASRIGAFGVGSWSWLGTSIGGGRATVDVPAAGDHTITFWMRDDGLAIDKVVLTTDEAYTPDGEGPPESARVGQPETPFDGGATDSPARDGGGGGDDAGGDMDGGMEIDAGSEDSGTALPTVTIEAESMTLDTGYMIDAGNTMIIRVVMGATTGTATAMFTGADGTYRVRPQIVAENDGQPMLEMLINGTSLFTETYPLGAAGMEPQELGPYMATLSMGDTIELIGTQSMTTAWARVDKIVFEGPIP